VQKPGEASPVHPLRLIRLFMGALALEALRLSNRNPADDPGFRWNTSKRMRPNVPDRRRPEYSQTKHCRADAGTCWGNSSPNGGSSTPIGRQWLRLHRISASGVAFEARARHGENALMMVARARRDRSVYQPVVSVTSGRIIACLNIAPRQRAALPNV